MQNRSLFDDANVWETDSETEKVSAHSGLFVSLLLRYPELGSVKYMPSTGCLVMGFVLRHVLSDHEFHSLQALVEESLQLFSQLSGNAIHVLQIKRTQFPPYSTIAVTRDIATLTPEELSLIVGLLRDRFSEELIFEGVETFEPDTLKIQDDMIEHMLDDVRQIPPLRDLIGFREGGRVVLFRQGEPK